MYIKLILSQLLLPGFLLIAETVVSLESVEKIAKVLGRVGNAKIGPCDIMKVGDFPFRFRFLCPVCFANKAPTQLDFAYYEAILVKCFVGNSDSLFYNY